MNADGMVDYYEPLFEWLKSENIRNGGTCGWDAAKNEFHPFEEMDFVGKCAETQDTKTSPTPSIDEALKKFIKPHPV